MEGRRKRHHHRRRVFLAAAGAACQARQHGGEQQGEGERADEVHAEWVVGGEGEGGVVFEGGGGLSLAHAGVGSASHLCGLLYQNAVQVDMTTVPYKGTAPAMTDLMGGQIDLMCDQTTNTTSQIEGKKVKAFAVTTNKRLTTPALKDLPTMQEAGLKGFEVTIWHGLYAPKGTPPDVVAKINAALKVALKDPEFIKKQEGLGAVVVTDKRVEPAEHKKFVAAEIAKWSPIIKAAGVYSD
mgnify:CR=1 FL=1